jgi:hypothetical protein
MKAFAVCTWTGRRVLRVYYGLVTYQRWRSKKAQAIVLGELSENTVDVATYHFTGSGQSSRKAKLITVCLSFTLEIRRTLFPLLKFSVNAAYFHSLFVCLSFFWFILRRSHGWTT